MKINSNKINTIGQYAVLVAQIFILAFPFLTQTFGWIVAPPALAYYHLEQSNFIANRGETLYIDSNNLIQKYASGSACIKLESLDELILQNWIIKSDWELW